MPPAFGQAKARGKRKEERKEERESASQNRLRTPESQIPLNFHPKLSLVVALLGSGLAQQLARVVVLSSKDGGVKGH